MSRVDYDAIIVGSGATGGWAAKALTESGMKVLLLEAGGQTEECQDAVAEASHLNVNGAALQRSYLRDRQRIQSSCYACDSDRNHLFIDDLENPYTTAAGHEFVWIRGRQVGGRTLTWAGHSYRMSDFDLQAASRDGFGEDWPLCYAELAPYYDQVESFIGVSGTIEHVQGLPDGNFRIPEPMTTGEVVLQKAVENRWRDRRVICGRSAMRCGPEKVEPPSKRRYISSTASTLRAAFLTGRLDLRSNAVVSHVLVDKTGNAAGVTFVDRLTKRVHEVFGRIVLLCASTIESTRIMLNSVSRYHPDGLGNSSGLLGHYLMDHFQLNITGIPSSIMHSPGYSVEVSHNGVYIPRFRNIARRDERFLRGYGTQAGVGYMPSAHSHMDVKEKTPADMSAFWLCAFGEMLPRKQNRVRLNKDQVDAWGIPTVHIECAHSDNEIAMAADALEAMKEMAFEAGFEVTMQSPISAPGSCIHEVGTGRMGSSPKMSVLNRFNQCWDAKNLFVVDGTCFVSQGPQNPTLTMMALTARACDYIVAQSRRGDL